MKLSLIYVAALLMAFVFAGVSRRQWLLATWAIAVLVFPTTFFKVGPAPVYVYDLAAGVLIGSLVLSGEWNRWPKGVPRWHLWLVGLAFRVSVVGGLVRYGMVPEIFWIWGHASLAWLSFGLAIVVATAYRRDEYRAGLRWGILISALALCGIAVVQYADLPGHEFFAAFFYSDSGGSDIAEILRRGVETNRANGPHGAPPGLAGMGILSMIAFWLASDDRHRFQRWLVVAASSATVLCTVSRHAVLAGVLGLAFIICLSEARVRAKLIASSVAIIILVALIAGEGLLKDSWSHRLSKTSEGVLSDDNIAGRVLYGPARLASFISREPSILITGAGLDPEKLESRNRLGSHFETGFVSNGFLLPLYYLGIFGFGLFLLFWIWAFRIAFFSSVASRGVRCGFVIMSAVIVASDNYGFVYEPAICFLFLVVGLIAGEHIMNWSAKPPSPPSHWLPCYPISTAQKGSMPVKVAFYSDALTSGHYGLGRYASELLRALNRLSAGVEVRPVSAHCRLDASQVRTLEKEAHYERLPLGRKMTATLWSLAGLPRLEHWAPWADVVHAVELDYRVATKKPFVVTIHDIGPLTHPDYFSTSHPWLLRKALRNALNHADAIVCVSQATADAVQNYTNCSLRDRLHVVVEGVSEDFFNPVPESHSGPATAYTNAAPYFLWTGSVNPRKNMARTVRAFEQIAATVPHHLVLVGGVGWDAHGTLQAVENSPVRSRIHMPGRVSDEQLRAFYQHAAGFVFPSLMEGFGLPILEAMASGCPVITSNSSSMPEVAGQDALLVDPTDVEALAGAMQRLAMDDALVNRLTTGGRCRAARFRWDTCATTMVQLYQSLARQPARARVVSPESASTVPA